MPPKKGADESRKKTVSGGRVYETRRGVVGREGSQREEMTGEQNVDEEEMRIEAAHELDGRLLRSPTLSSGAGLEQGMGAAEATIFQRMRDELRKMPGTMSAGRIHDYDGGRLERLVEEGRRLEGDFIRRSARHEVYDESDENVHGRRDEGDGNVLSAGASSMAEAFKRMQALLDEEEQRVRDEETMKRRAAENTRLGLSLEAQMEAEIAELTAQGHIEEARLCLEKWRARLQGDSLYEGQAVHVKHEDVGHTTQTYTKKRAPISIIHTPVPERAETTTPNSTEMMELMMRQLMREAAEDRRKMQEQVERLGRDVREAQQGLRSRTQTATAGKAKIQRKREELDNMLGRPEQSNPAIRTAEDRKQQIKTVDWPKPWKGDGSDKLDIVTYLISYDHACAKCGLTDRERCNRLAAGVTEVVRERVIGWDEFLATAADEDDAPQAYQGLRIAMAMAYGGYDLTQRLLAELDAMQYTSYSAYGVNGYCAEYLAKAKPLKNVMTHMMLKLSFLKSITNVELRRRITALYEQELYEDGLGEHDRNVTIRRLQEAVHIADEEAAIVEKKTHQLQIPANPNPRRNTKGAPRWEDQQQNNDQRPPLQLQPIAVRQYSMQDVRQQTDEGTPHQQIAIDRVALTNPQHQAHYDQLRQRPEPWRRMPSWQAAAPGAAQHDQHGGRILRCYTCQQEGHIARECPKSQLLRCHICQQEGHVARDCPNDTRERCAYCNKRGHARDVCRLMARDLAQAPASQNNARGQTQMLQPNEREELERLRRTVQQQQTQQRPTQQQGVPGAGGGGRPTGNNRIIRTPEAGQQRTQAQSNVTQGINNNRHALQGPLLEVDTRMDKSDMNTTKTVAGKPEEERKAVVNVYRRQCTHDPSTWDNAYEVERNQYCVIGITGHNGRSKDVIALVDQGSESDHISAALARELGLVIAEVRGVGHNGCDGSESRQPIVGKTVIDIEIGGLIFPNHEMLVVDVPRDNPLAPEHILGGKFQRRARYYTDWGQNMHVFTLDQEETEAAAKVHRVPIIRKTGAPWRKEMIVVASQGFVAIQQEAGDKERERNERMIDADELIVAQRDGEERREQDEKKTMDAKEIIEMVADHTAAHIIVPGGTRINVDMKPRKQNGSTVIKEDVSYVVDLTDEVRKRLERDYAGIEAQAQVCSGAEMGIMLHNGTTQPMKIRKSMLCGYAEPLAQVAMIERPTMLQEGEIERKTTERADHEMNERPEEFPEEWWRAASHEDRQRTLQVWKNYTQQSIQEAVKRLREITDTQRQFNQSLRDAVCAVNLAYLDVLWPADRLKPQMVKFAEMKMRLKDGAIPKKERIQQLSRIEVASLHAHLITLLLQGRVEHCMSPWNTRACLVERPKDIRRFMEGRTHEQVEADLAWVLSRTDENLLPMTPEQEETWHNVRKLFRITGDYRHRNLLAVPCAYPMRATDEAIDRVVSRGPKAMSIVDSNDGFHSVRIDAESRPSTAISTTTGLHVQFTTLPQGCAESATIYAAIAHWTAKPIQDILQEFQDDMLCFTCDDPVNHVMHLRRVYQRFLEVGWGCDIRKPSTRFLEAEIEYLGGIISAHSLKPAPSKVEAILNIAPPTTKEEVKVFLGLTGYQSKFIHGYAELVAPISDLLGKDVPDNITEAWGEEQQKAFDEVKECLSREPCLQPVNWARPFIVAPDACKKGRGIGAVLYQRDSEGQPRPVAYFSRKLKPYQRRYSPTEVELLGLRDSCEHWRSYLFGREFEIWTDHKALEGILRFRDPHGKLARWAAFMQSFRFSIKHRDGTHHLDSDAVSRLWHIGEERDMEAEPTPYERGIYWPIFELSTESNGIITNRMRLQEEGRYIQTVVQYLNVNNETVVNDGEQTQRPARRNRRPSERMREAMQQDQLTDDDDNNGKRNKKVRKMWRPKRKKRDHDTVNMPEQVENDTGTLQRDTRNEEPMRGWQVMQEQEEQLLNEAMQDALWETLDERAPQQYAWLIHKTFEEEGKRWRVVRIDTSRTGMPKACLKPDDDNDRTQGVMKDVQEVQLKVLAQEALMESHGPGSWNGTVEKLYETQCMDEYLGPIIEALTLEGDEAIVDDAKYQAQFVMRGGVLHRRVWNKEADAYGYKVAVPKICVDSLLNHAHVCTAHAGSRRLLETLQKLWYWPSMRRDTIEYVKQCGVCKVTKSAGLPHFKQPHLQEPNRWYSGLSRPYEAIQIDLIGPLPKSAQFHNQYIFTIVDRLTKHAEAFALGNKTADEVAMVFFEEIIRRYGPPRIVTSDGGKEFVNKIFKSLNAILKSRRVVTTPYHPQSNGGVERFNQTIETMLRSYMQEDQCAVSSWDTYLASAVHAYNTTVHTVHGYTPFYLLHGYECPMPLDVELVTEPVEEIDEWVAKRRKMLLHAWKMAAVAMENQAERYNDGEVREKRKWQWRAYTMGQWVYVSRPKHLPTDENAETTGKKSLKLATRWSGPYQITKVISPLVYELQIGPARKLWHALNMKAY